jgi:hypothetical protein
MRDFQLLNPDDCNQHIMQGAVQFPVSLFGWPNNFDKNRDGFDLRIPIGGVKK